MSGIIPPTPGDLPSSKALRRATAAAIVVALFLTVAVVLPAERGIDPTGIGRVLGFTEMGEIKLQLAREMEEQAEGARQEFLTDSADVAESGAMARDSTALPTAAADAPVSGRRDISTIVVPAAGRAEFVLEMKMGARVRYSWKVDRSSIAYIIRGDSATSATTRIYRRGLTETGRVGVIVAAFEGRHGWYWRNTTDSTVTVTIHTSGEYQRGG